MLTRALRPQAGSALPLSDKKFTVKKQAVLGRESEARARVAPRRACTPSPGLPQDFFSLYTLGKELGKGQFGTVHECFFKADGSRWAAKLISKTKLKRVAAAAAAASPRLLF